MKHLGRVSIFSNGRSHNSILLMLLLMGTGAPGCFSSTEPLLTPATDTGANTISFKVNGKVFLPSPHYPFPAVDASIALHPPTWDATLYAVGGLSSSIGLTIHFDGPIDTGRYPLRLDPLSDDTYPNAEYWPDNTHRFVTQDTLPAWVHVMNLDTVKKIVSGTFEIDMASSQSNEILHITEGRFDFSFKR